MEYLAGRHGMTVISVEFRNFLSHPDPKIEPKQFPAGLNDCYSGLEWTHAHKEELGCETIVNYGESGSATLIFPPWTSEFKEASELTGTKGRLTLDSYGHVTRTNIRGCAAQMISATLVLAGPDPIDNPHHP